MHIDAAPNVPPVHRPLAQVPPVRGLQLELTEFTLLLHDLHFASSSAQLHHISASDCVYSQVPELLLHVSQVRQELADFWLAFILSQAYTVNMVITAVDNNNLTICFTMFVFIMFVCFFAVA